MKVYAVARFLRDDNKEVIQKVCEETGCKVSFYHDAEEADGKVGDGEIIYCSNPRLLRQMPALKWCHSSNAGVDSFIKSGIFDSGEVLLTNSSGSYGRAISEHVIMLTLMLMRQMPEYKKILDKRGWANNLPVRSIAGSKVRVIGTGDLGQNIGRRFRALGAASVTGYNRSGRKADGFDAVHKAAELDELLPDTDVLVMCLPGTSKTEGLLSAERIGLLPETAYVVNVGRGTAIDQDALIDALNGGRLAGAALDVMYPEPLPEDHPLWMARNCIITPHISGDMGLPYTVDRTVEIFCGNLRRFASGEPLGNLINVGEGY